MLALAVVLVVYSCTYVGCNARIDSSAKSAFFIILGVVIAVCALLSWLLG